MPVIAVTGEQQFYGMIVQICDKDNPAIFRFSRRKEIDPKYGISPEMSGSFDLSPFDVMVLAQCFKIQEHIGEDEIKRKNFKTIPEMQSDVYEASATDVAQFYSTKWAKYWLGTLASNDTIPIPMELGEAVQKPMVIAGGTGSGKTVLTKDLVKSIIHDPDQMLKTSLLIFDIQNEYAWYNTKGEPGILHYRLLRDRLQVFTLDMEAWKTQRAIGSRGNPKSFVIFTRNIDAADIIPLLPQEALSEKMIYTIYALESEAKMNRHRPSVTESGEPIEPADRGKWTNFWEVLNYYYTHPAFGELFQSSGDSYGAMQWRLRPLLEEGGLFRDFIRDGKADERDTYEYIRDMLNREIMGDRVFSFL